MAADKLKDYGRFMGQLVGASFAAGVLAAAGEHILGAALGRGRFWGVPRHFYQLSLGVEALWLAVLTAALFGLAGTAYYWWWRRKRPVRLASPSLFVVTAAACGVAASYFLATVDVVALYAKPRLAVVVVWAIFLATAAAWVALAVAAYRLISKIRPRAGASSSPSVTALRACTLALLLPFVGAAVWAVWRARAPRPRKPDIYFVVMDAFRADRLEPYGAPRRLAPALESFGEGAVLFRDAFAPSSWTKPAVTSAFTSTSPSTHGVNGLFSAIPGEALTLAEYLRGYGYRTLGVSANPEVGRQAGMAAGFDVLDATTLGTVLDAAGPPTSAGRFLVRYPVGSLWRASRGGLFVNRRLAFWARLVGGPPRFLYIHYMEPHTPNLPRAEYLGELKPFLDKVEKRRAREIELGKYFFAEVATDPAFVPDYNDDELALARALYDADIRRMDVVIADLLENVVPASGEGPEPIIIITADHGEEFLEHGRWLHGAGLHREVAEIPLIIKLPGRAPAVLDGPVSLVDLAPTVASAVGLPVPDGWEGLDLTPYAGRGQTVPRRTLLLEGIQELSVEASDPSHRTIEINVLVGGGYYYVKDENAGVEYLYDRRLDPWQVNDLARAGGSPGLETVLAERRGELGRMKRDARAQAYAPARAYIPPSLRRSLRALGYVR
jgi:arylsulfatase A-like enzyme